MSRLDSFIERMKAQRACIDAAAERLAGVPGVVLEIGLGNGRTYDHVRERFPGRDIYVFERKLAAQIGTPPDAEHLVMGDLLETLPPVVRRFQGQVVLVHADVGPGDPGGPNLSRFLERTLPPALAPGALVLSVEPLTLPGTERLAMPDGVPHDRYFMYRQP
jgi:hypothetical protein